MPIRRESDERANSLKRAHRNGLKANNTRALSVVAGNIANNKWRQRQQLAYSTKDHLNRFTLRQRKTWRALRANEKRCAAIEWSDNFKLLGTFTFTLTIALSLRLEQPTILYGQCVRYDGHGAHRPFRRAFMALFDCLFNIASVRVQALKSLSA